MTKLREVGGSIEEREDRAGRYAALRDALDTRVLVLDGATGTGLQEASLVAADFGGPELEGCNEVLCRTRPDVVRRLHESFLEAGADIVETNSFGSTPLVLSEYGLGGEAFELNRRSAELAREACAAFDVPGRLRFVCGSIGPTTKAISVTGGVTFEELIENFRAQALGLMAGGADYLLLETCQDTRNIKAGLLGLEQAFGEAGWSLPIAISVTIEPTGTMLGGQDAEALAVSLLHTDLLYLGLNCATGPELMTEHVRTLSELSRTATACVPNAGLPDEEGEYHEGARVFRTVLGRFLERGWLNVIGGCCGTTPEHIRTLAALAREHSPRSIAVHQRSLVSGLEAVELTAENRPLLVGERTNVLGSRKFRRLIAAGEFEAAAEIGRGQARAGAQVLDVCMQDPDREEIEDVEKFLDRIVRMIKLPLMIDSTDAEVMERALTYCQGKSVLNSINLEDGLKRFEEVAPLARRYGAALVVGTIDEKGMAVTVERKLEVAARSYALLTEDFGIRAEDIWWDPLVFPCGTGDEDYIGSAAQTIDGVRRLKAEFPLTKTILGVSNVSFGLPPAGREILNSVFLYYATKAGLDAAIVNTQGLARYAEVADEDRALAERLIFLDGEDVSGSDEAIAQFTAHFRQREARTNVVPRADLPLDERLSRAVIEGSKEGVPEDLATALEDSRWAEPLDIINGPLMAGMAEVGRLFNDNQLIVAEVLQSAEVMKSAVSFLEEHMESSAGRSRGKLLLATVKGDVHDIGKNLVEIVLSNNGFEVVNLGIRVPSEQLIQAVREHEPDVIGLSGLLVKSAQQMVLTAGDLAEIGIDTPLVVGGAALSARFTHGRIAANYNGLCTYAKDAMHGLDLIERIVDPERREALDAEVLAAVDTAKRRPKPERARTVSTERSALVRRDLEAPAPPDLDHHVEVLPVEQVWDRINPQMLYGKHLGLRGSARRLKDAGDPTFEKLDAVVETVKAELRESGFEARAAWRFFPARSQGNELVLDHPDGGGVAARWELPRQAGGDGLCLADYVLEGDHVALFVTTAGQDVRSRVEALKEEGEYLRSHVLAAIAIESAEGAAELVHARIRASWGFADPEDLAPKDLFAARYRGKRYSFGYPACPDLSGQRALFRALKPEEIGVQLTEGDMMDPEASVSALVFHHPDARYFGV